MKSIISECINNLSNMFKKSAISAYAAQAAFFMMLSFFPFLMFFFSILKMTPLDAAELEIWIVALLPSAFSSLFNGIVEDIYNNSSGGVISATIIVALWMSSKGFFSLQQGLNSMYVVKENRNYLQLRLNGIIYSFVFAIVLIISLGLGVFGKSIQKHFFADWKSLEHFVNIRVIIFIPVLFLFFMVLYIVLPNRKQRIRNQIPGAIVSTMAWIIYSYLFSIYVDRYTNYATFYGTMTTIALVMLWIYWCMYVLFIGGFINKFLEKYYNEIKENVRYEYNRDNNEQDKC